MIITSYMQYKDLMDKLVNNIGMFSKLHDEKTLKQLFDDIERLENTFPEYEAIYRYNMIISK